MGQTRNQRNQRKIGINSSSLEDAPFEQLSRSKQQQKCRDDRYENFACKISEILYQDPVRNKSRNIFS
jgi:hypothetical protein